MRKCIRIFLTITALYGLLTSCTTPLDEEQNPQDTSQGIPSNTIELIHSMDMNNLNAEITMQVEFVSDTGIVIGSGSNPDITGVIGMQQYEVRIGGSIVTEDNEIITFYGDDQYLEMTNHSYLTSGKLSVLPHFFRMTYYTDQNGDNWLVSDQYDVRIPSGFSFAFKIGQRISWRYL